MLQRLQSFSVCTQTGLANSRLKASPGGKPQGDTSDSLRACSPKPAAAAFRALKASALKALDSQSDKASTAAERKPRFATRAEKCRDRNKTICSGLRRRLIASRGKCNTSYLRECIRS